MRSFENYKKEVLLMKKLIAMILALVCLAMLCACGTVEETPTEPACNHTFEGPTCDAPKTCTLCGLTDGNPLRHNWVPANCKDPKTCVRCGLIDETAPLHNWKDATCESAKTCVRCFETEGDALGHTMENDTCTTCGKTAADLQG